MSAPVFFNSLLTEEESVLETIEGLADSNDMPDKGTVALDKLCYLVMGPVMFLWWQFKESSGASPGVGDYLLKIPGGYEAHPDFININDADSANIVGSGQGVDSAGLVVALRPVIFDSTHIAFGMPADGLLDEGDTLALDAGGSPVEWNVFAVIPLAGRNYQF